MTIEAMQNRYQMMARVAREIMHDGQDFGVVPGTGSKPSLFKPGAEKLTVFFGLQKRFEIIEKVEDWTGQDHNGEPFFYYMVRCYLSRNGMEVASMEGSCNSWEKKYRYRQGERACPKCGATAIIKGKAEYVAAGCVSARRAAAVPSSRTMTPRSPGKTWGKFPTRTYSIKSTPC